MWVCSKHYFTERRAARVFGCRIELGRGHGGWRVSQDTNAVESLNRVWRYNVTGRTARRASPFLYLYKFMVERPLAYAHQAYEEVLCDFKSGIESLAAWKSMFLEDALANYVATRIRARLPSDPRISPHMTDVVWCTASIVGSSNLCSCCR